MFYHKIVIKGLYSLNCRIEVENIQVYREMMMLYRVEWNNSNSHAEV